MNITKQEILSKLPKGFKCSVSKDGLTIQIWVDTNEVGGWTNANRLVYDLAKKLKLEEVGAGTDLTTMVRDWEFINPVVEKELITDAKDVLKAMKKFFGKYGNRYCQSSKAYDIIEQMRNLIATDEA